MKNSVKMRLEAYILLIMNVLAYGLKRGPHHPHGQTPVEHKHHHYKPKGGESLTKDTQLLHDEEHLKEDSEVLARKDLSKMTQEELEFHYFSAHDFDRDNKLDGSELLKAIYHTMEHESPDPDENSPIEPEANFDLDTCIAIVDRTLETDDTDNDGFITYAEFRAARKKYDDSEPKYVVQQKRT